MSNEPGSASRDPLQATPPQRALWQRLQSYRFGQNEAAFAAFLRRVAKQVQCSTAQAQELVEEYRRFCFLACTDTHDVTPSPLVDQVWHVHLTDTREYWQQFCPQVLQTTLHHQPGRGDAGEQAQFQAQYRQTLERYRMQFGEPPAQWWPAARPQRSTVDLPQDDTAEATLQALRGTPQPQRGVPLAVIGWAIAALAVGMVCRSANGGALSPLHWRGDYFLPLFIALIGLAWSIAAWLRRVLRRGRSAGSLDASELAYLGGGADRVADLWFTELLVCNAVYLEPDATEPARRWVRCHQHSAVPPALEPALQMMRTTEDPVLAVHALRALAASLEQRLIDKGVWLSQAQAWKVRLACAMPLALVWVLGLCKLMIGVQGDHPVGYLLCLMVLTTLLVLGFALARARRTLSGQTRLDALRQTQRRGAARPGELVALYGTAALIGTAWADYHSLRAPHGHAGGSGSSCGGGGGGDSGCGGGGDGGGSDGGGGCGGCGGGGD
ncbi:TIGR04222 domain-containing membrane protein [Xanthomonas prunicola]|uniref:TIGR04222 domain-containing membrane protein n=1 Tax=Xanthomonas prunicola TaxID=2053930 RepID=A0A2N3RLG2_9XANT|nr:TIGR04222 domain-containing membrane protein [Xanthomonas prunicola]PKV13344.1 TIGR04222 domain-containing membrane protein [Xanthomonas prunicola]PKV17621.1 TIGR04222 domain-containing membrane protein [Xanthomonas prunicola]PKV21517.1 TIGR04222 domain-containing membrane protein [Xanthomonas prunicola]